MGGRRPRTARIASAVALTLSALVGLDAPAPDGVQAQAQTVTPPNVVVILTDDQRRNGLQEVMPATTRIFGRSGIDFTSAYATTPLCCPSRASIYSGRYAHNHGEKTNKTATRPSFHARGTVQHLLQGNGYETAMFGKYPLVQSRTEAPPFFDEWATYRLSQRGYYDVTWNFNGEEILIPGYTTRIIGELGQDFITRQEAADDQPWLMFLSTTAPHAPFTSVPRNRHARVSSWRGNPAVHEEDLSDKPPHNQDPAYDYIRGVVTRKRQLRTLMSVDDMVEKVFEALRLTGETENTLAFYLSDNGHLWGEHRLFGKRHPYLPSVQIPLLLKWPARLDGRRKDGRLVANIDLAPTILEAAGVEPDPNYPHDGRSLLGTSSRSRLLLEYWSEGDLAIPSWAATLTDGYQYVEHYDGSGAPTFREYYDLIIDPWQLENSYDAVAVPDRVLLEEQLTRDRSCIGDTCP